MRTIRNAMIALAMGLPLLAQAEPEEESAVAAAEAAGREALREELEVARREMAEAARRLARVRRELADMDVEGLRSGQLEGLDEQLQVLEGEAVDVGALVNKEVIRRLHITRPRLGVLLGGADDANEVVGVTPGSGAEKAGIVAGDRLVAIDGRAVDATDTASLHEPLKDVEPGQSVPVEIERDGESMTLEVRVSSPVRDFRVLTHDIRGPSAAPGAPAIDREVFVLEGERLRIPEPPMPPRLAGLGRHSHMIGNHEGLEPYFGTADGVVVLQVDGDNPLGLEAGDVVLAIDGEPVSRPVEIGRRLMVRERGETITLDIMRAGKRQQLEGALPERPVADHRPPRVH